VIVKTILIKFMLISIALRVFLFCFGACT